MEEMSNESKVKISSNDFNLPNEEKITVEKLKEIYDNFIIQCSSLTSSSYLINVLHLLENVDKTILINDLIVNHEFYSFLTNKMYHLLKKFYKLNYLTESESLLFGYIGRIFFRINLYSEKLIRPIKKCLNYISNYEKYYSYEDYLKDFSKLISLYIQNEQIINAILNCLASKYYLQLFEQLSYQKFLLINCPAYWIAYTGPNKEEMSNKLLDTLLVPSASILPRKYSKKFSKAIKYLIDLLNDSFVECNKSVLINDHLILITDAILAIFNEQSLIEERRSIIKSSIQLLITLINKYEIILKHVKQRQDIFHKLINIEKDVYLILASLMNNNQIINIYNENRNFARVIREYLNQQFYQNHLLTKRFKLILESSTDDPEQTILSSNDDPISVGSQHNPAKLNRNLAESYSDPLGTASPKLAGKTSITVQKDPVGSINQNPIGKPPINFHKNPVGIDSHKPIEKTSITFQKDPARSANHKSIENTPITSYTDLIAAANRKPIETAPIIVYTDPVGSTNHKPAEKSSTISYTYPVGSISHGPAGKTSISSHTYPVGYANDKPIESASMTFYTDPIGSINHKPIENMPIAFHTNPVESVSHKPAGKTAITSYTYPVESDGYKPIENAPITPYKDPVGLTTTHQTAEKTPINSHIDSAVFTSHKPIEKAPTTSHTYPVESNSYELIENAPMTSYIDPFGSTSYKPAEKTSITSHKDPTESVNHKPIENAPINFHTDAAGFGSDKSIEELVISSYENVDESTQIRSNPIDVVEGDVEAVKTSVRDLSKVIVESIVVSNENESKEEVTLIWYDKNIGKRDDTKKTFEFFQEINDYVLIYSERETFIKYINQIKNEKVFLILSGSNPKDILNEIHDHKQIDSIFLFSNHRQKYEKYLNNEKYYKIIAIHTEYQSLINDIKENIRFLIKQSEAATLFDQEERSIKNLNRHLYQFRSFLIFKQVLLKSEYNCDIDRNEMIKIFENYYQNNPKELNNIQLFQRTYKCEDAIDWYTKQTFIYRIINKAFRIEDYQTILLLSFFIHHLSENIQKEYQQLKKNTNIILSYRALKLSSTQIDNLKNNIGKIVATNGFFSTTRSKNVALTFVTKQTKHPNVQTVMLEIDVDISKLTTSLADVAEYSEFPEEQEILFDLGASFIINSIVYDHIEKMWIVKLSGVEEESFLKDIQSYLGNKYLTNNINILLGQIFFIMEKYEISRKYLEKILKFYQDEDSEHLSIIYDYIGQAYENENNYDQARINYRKACHYYHLLNHPEDVARITNYIGNMYFNKNDKINAKIYFTKSYDIWKQFQTNLSVNENCEIARLMNCFACLEDDNEIARDYLLKALNIYENPSHICHIDNHDYFISQVSEHLAERFYQDNHHDQALHFIIKSVTIREKYLSSINGKKNFLKSLMKLWKICENYQEDIWLIYQDEFLQLADIELIKLIPELKDFINDAIFLKSNYLNQKQDENNNLLEHSLNSLNLIMKTDPMNYEKIIQLHIDVGLAFAKTKDYHWASQHYTKALEMCNTYTPNHSKILSTIFQCLSDVSLLDKNDYDETFSLNMKSININEKTSHLTDIEKEAQSYFDTGEKLMTQNFDKALEFLKKSLEIREKYLKKDDVIIGICHQDIGVTYINKAMLDIALEHYNKAIVIYSKHLNDTEEHEFNIKLLNGKCHCDIGRIYYNKNEFDQSTEYFLKTIEIMENNSNSDNLCFLSDCYEGIGLNYYKKSEYDLSINYYQKCLDFLLTHMKSSVLCDHRKEVASCLIDLSCVYIDKKEYELALKNLQKVSNILPEDHKDLGNSFLFIGLCHMEQEQYEFAVTNYQIAITNFEKHLPLNQQNYALCLSHLGTCYSNMQKNLYHKGIDCIIKAISIYEENSSENGGNIAQCYWIYAFILSKQGKYDEAIDNVYKSLEYRVNEDTINVGLSNNLLGVCYYKKCSYEQALSSLIISMENYEKHLSDLHNEIGASIYYDIGTSLLKLNNYDQALEYAIRSLEIREDILPLVDLQKCESHTLIALIYSQKEIQEYHKCNEHYIKALQLAEQIISTGDDIENIGEIYENIAQICFNVNNLQQSKEYYQIALKYMKIDKIDDHPDIQRIENIIQSLTQT